MSYSGQEIVSQEECKIILAEFFEGVDCYNATDNTIKFTIQDWAGASYDSNTNTLTTRNFSCRPVIIEDGIIGITFEAALAEGATGLEVILTTDEYTKTRIMPIAYLPTCNRVDWDSDYDITDWIYVKEFCKDDSGALVVKVVGDIDAVFQSSIVIVGERETNSTTSNPLVLEVLDYLEAPMVLSPSFEQAIEQFETYVYNEETNEYELATVDRTLTTITIQCPQDEVYLKFSGAYNYTATIYDCNYLFNVGNVSSFCNISYPTPHTEITFINDWENVTVNDQIVTADDTTFKLLPETQVLEGLGDSIVKFKLATQIEFLTPREATYDIFACTYDPGFSIDFFNIFFYMYWDTEDLAWYMDLKVYGAFIWDNASIIDRTAGYLKIYQWFNGLDELLFLDEGIVDLQPELYSLNITKIPVRYCNGYYTIHRQGRVGDIPNFTPIVFDDHRIGWDSQNCTKIFNCSTASLYLPTCVECTDIEVTNAAGELEPGIRLSETGVGANEVCTCGGVEDKVSFANACDGPSDLALGAYPYIEPGSLSPTVVTTEWVYFSNTSMYVRLDTPTGLIYYVHIGDLSWGVSGQVVEDNASGSQHPVSFWAFVMLAVIGIPYKYLWPGKDISPSFWYNKFFDDPFCVDVPIYEAGAGFDFKMPIDKLQLGGNWSNGYDWSHTCDWAQSETEFQSGVNALDVGLSNLQPLDDWSCEATKRMKHFTTNLPLRDGVPPPPTAYGSMQDAYNAFVEEISLLPSRDAEAYAYTHDIYIQGLGLEDDED